MQYLLLICVITAIINTSSQLVPQGGINKLPHPKMAHPRYIRWLYEQLPELMAKGILTREQAAQLRAHYGAVEEKPAFNIGFLVAGMLGVLLIGSGILLIFAYNWEDLSKSWRTVLSFIPLIISQIFFGYAFFYQRKSAAWTEGASTFLMLMLAACIALISQTYHIWGTPESFLWTWMVLSIPLIYLLNSSLVTIIYLVGITSWTMQVHGSDSVWYWLLFAVAVPHFIYNWRKRTQALRRDALGWALSIIFTFGWFGTIENHIAEYSLVGSMALLSTYYLLGIGLFPNRGASFMSRPLQTFAVACSFVFLLLLTYDFINVPEYAINVIIMGYKYSTGAGIINFITLLLLFAGYIYLLVKDFQTRKPIDHFATLFPVFGVLILLFHKMNAEIIAFLLANAYLLAWGVYYLISGVRERRMVWVNIGMFFILTLATARFFDTHWSLLIKGVIFVLLGVGFLIANIMLSRRLAANL